MTPSASGGGVVSEIRKEGRGPSLPSHKGGDGQMRMEAGEGGWIP